MTEEKSNEQPRITPEVSEAVAQYYIVLNMMIYGSALSADRFFQETYQTTRFSAKLRLSNICTLDDVHNAIKHLHPDLMETKDPETGKTTLDVFREWVIDAMNAQVPADLKKEFEVTRTTMALAKLRLSDICSSDDVEKAINLHKASQEAIRDLMTRKEDQI